MTAVPPRPAAPGECAWPACDLPATTRYCPGHNDYAAPEPVCRYGHAESEHWLDGRYSCPTAPDATAGDGLRAQIEDRLERYWENGVPDWAVEDILALPALRDVLAAAARDAEKVRRVEELVKQIDTGTPEGIYGFAPNEVSIRIRRALDPS